jgi:NAD(P)-dependent dehydrogenase (short-subunit alcohol dehydrogenase family)
MIRLICILHIKNNLNIVSSLRVIIMTSQASSYAWLITGSSTGFGRALAEAALAQGDSVIVTARGVSEIQDLADKLVGDRNGH